MKFVSKKIAKENFQLLHSASYLAYQEEEVFFYGLKNRVAKAVFHAFFLEKKILKSPRKATFGGFETSQLSAKEIHFFLQKTNRFLKQNQIQNLLFSQEPCFSTKQLFLHKKLLQMGAKILYTDQNFHISVSETKFEKKIHLSLRRRLQKMEKADFLVKKLENYDLKTVWDFIAKCRKQKNTPFTMSWEQMQKFHAEFSEKISVFVVKKDAQWLSLGLCVRFSEDILYHLYPASLVEWNAFSPAILVHKAIYEYCQAEKIQRLDLGIATDKGVLNVGLFEFKKRLGGICTPKYTYSLKI